MIARYRDSIMGIKSYNGSWCKWSDVEKLQRERDEAVVLLEEFVDLHTEWIELSDRVYDFLDSIGNPREGV